MRRAALSAALTARWSRVETGSEGSEGGRKERSGEWVSVGYISGVMPPKARPATPLYILVIFYCRPWQHVQVRGEGDFSIHLSIHPSTYPSIRVSFSRRAVGVSYYVISVAVISHLRDIKRSLIYKISDLMRLGGGEGIRNR